MNKIKNKNIILKMTNFRFQLSMFWQFHLSLLSRVYFEHISNFKQIFLYWCMLNAFMELSHDLLLNHVSSLLQGWSKITEQIYSNCLQIHKCITFLTCIWKKNFFNKRYIEHSIRYCWFNSRNFGVSSEYILLKVILKYYYRWTISELK